MGKTTRKGAAYAGLFLLIAAMVIMLCSCGGYENLEEYYSGSDSAREHIDEVINIEAENMKVSVSGNEIHYDVVYNAAFDEELRTFASEQIKKELKSMKPVFSAIAKTVEDETDISGIKVKLSYKDKSGYTLYEDTISSEGE